MVEAVLRAAGPVLAAADRRNERRGRRACPSERWASAQQLQDGRVVVRASCELAVDEARFMLALDDDTSEFHRRLRTRPAARPDGAAPARDATAAQGDRDARGRSARSAGSSSRRAEALADRARDHPRRAARIRRPARRSPASRPPRLDRVRARREPRRDADAARARRSTSKGCGGRRTRSARLGRERGVGPWTVGVIALQGLGRYDAGLVDDLGLVKLLASLRGRWPEPGETAELLEPYGEWQGLASVFLLQGFKRGLVPGASMDRARLVRSSARPRRLRARP